MLQLDVRARKKGRPFDVAGNQIELLYVVARYNIQHTTPAYRHLRGAMF